MDDRVSDVRVSRALVEQAKRVLEQLQNTDDPHTGRALESPASRAEPLLIAAALAVRRHEFPKSNGEPNYLKAARAFLPKSKFNRGSGTAVKNWCDKLSQLDQIQQQRKLATSIEDMDDQELQLVNDVVAEQLTNAAAIASAAPNSAEDTVINMPTALLDDGTLTGIVLHPPQGSPPVSAVPSPPYTATRSGSEAAPSEASFVERFASLSVGSHNSTTSSSGQRAYVPPHHRGASAGRASAARSLGSLADLSHQRQSKPLTLANVSSLERDHIRPRAADDVISVATSAVSYNSTFHSGIRLKQRSISPREIQRAIKHGWPDQTVEPFLRIKFEYQGVAVITAPDMKTVITTWRTRVRTAVHTDLVKVLDGPGGAYLADSAPMTGTELMRVSGGGYQDCVTQATTFMRRAAEGCKLMHFPDVPTLLLDFGCGCLEQGLQFGELTEPCWTREQLVGVLARVREQTGPSSVPHARILALLASAVDGRELPAPFPWAARFDMQLDALREAIDTCGGSVAACGTDMVNRNLLHLYLHMQDEKAVQLLIERGGADFIDSPNVHGRMPIFSAAGSSARDASKATRLTRQMCEAKCSVDWTDVNGRNILHHAVKKPDSGRLEIVQLLLARGANPNEGDRNGVSPAQLARREGHPLVADLLGGQPVCVVSLSVCMVRVQTCESAVTLSFQIVCNPVPVPVLSKVHSAGLVVFRRLSGATIEEDTVPSITESFGAPQFLLLQSSMRGQLSKRWTPPMGQQISELGSQWLQEYACPSHGGMPLTSSMAQAWTRQLTGLPETGLRVVSEEPLTPPLTYWDDKLKRDKVSVYFLAELIEPHAEICLGTTSGRDQLGNAPAVDYVWLPLEAAKKQAGWREIVDTLDAAAALMANA